ncbi:MAG: hypothetical protein QOG03_490 [Actinomycetota bacterium]|nr:hypothetical protein [Actinomycetota bacterium]
MLILVASLSAIYPTCRAEHTRRQLSQARTDLHNVNQTLAAARQELTSQRTAHDKLQADLDAAKSALNDAKRSADFQGSQLTIIKRCLNDIRDFDNATARGDQNAARAAAASANQTCTEAEAVL